VNFVDAVMEGIKNNIFEIGYGMTAGLIKDLEKTWTKVSANE